MNIKLLETYCQSKGLSPYRFRQILQNYFSGHCHTFGDMSDLPLSLRQELDHMFRFLSVKPLKLSASQSTKKVLLELSDGLQIESVLMDYGQWITVCISSQVGCSLGCKFCATGQMGFKRDLTAEEIIDQIIFWQYQLKPKYIGRVVFMGMGEPFLNWDTLLESLKVLNQYLKIGARKISVSTSGVVPRIYDFANLDTEINLAISLHSAVQQTREKLMPIARQYHLSDLQKSLDYYIAKTHRQIFLEYALIQDVNDSNLELEALVKLLKSNKLFYLNLIPLNPTAGSLKPSPKLHYFQDQLTSRHVNFSLRQSLGADISSACGQLTVHHL